VCGIRRQGRLIARKVDLMMGVGFMWGNEWHDETSIIITVFRVNYSVQPCDLVHFEFAEKLKPVLQETVMQLIDVLVVGEEITSDGHHYVNTNYNHNTCDRRERTAELAVEIPRSIRPKKERLA